ncbi:thiolase-like protein [Phialemonium atrogriseum]|uniref:Thiolase-like protein n=1 Tax=Phialemonium atrogriseum TaxID=1093897 RepID=A0AAJ0C0C0_9PEZI|nr:thiolase-like protein [Phialemonium atrogriseum]KAK1767810.1 thiolase-like protein [Phialemonium atrogriseum]
MRGLPARALVLALEVSTTMVRSELDSVDALQETRIGVALFSDCAGAVVLTNGIGSDGPGPRASLPSPQPVYDLLGWEHAVLPDTSADLGFDVDPAGWKVVLSPRVPHLAQASIRPAYDALLRSLPPPPLGPPAGPRSDPADFDWAMHPGGATILTGAERAMGISSEHMRASYDTYMNHGNSSSATIFAVLDRLRSKDMDALAPPARGEAGGRPRPREHVVACAFGPGITVEMCMLRRRNVGQAARAARDVSGLQTPPETESEVSSRSGDGDGDDDAEAAGATETAIAAGEGDGVREPAGWPRAGDGDGAGDDDAFISEALAGVELD